MIPICVATMDGRVYYSISSRLRKAGMAFESKNPSEVHGLDCLILTTRIEAQMLGGSIIAIEDLDEDPIIMKGQILSRVNDEGKRDLVIGIDPGSRIGLAGFYGGTRLISQTLTSPHQVCELVSRLAIRVPNRRVIIRIGNGERDVAKKLLQALVEMLSNAIFEIVDESGTSQRTPRYKGLTRDQSAASKIAFRKGTMYQASNSS
jgi:hypothetical protein